MESEGVSQAGGLMHESSYIGMSKRLQEHCADLELLQITVLDIGSLDVNGTYRPLMAPDWSYIGADLRAGPNVDVCMPGEYELPLESDSVDLIISGQCLEHCRNPFRLVAEATRVLKPGGLMLLVAPFLFFEHREPVDCFRFLPDGMRAIFDECGIETIDTHMDATQLQSAGHVDCWAVGRKPNGNT
jgi:SAM-dependent methyltransferase